ncbi:unnamed protein product [Rotaria sp. Silwood1]|nr:unnamed protein product [Rotaria sp. Silwood1]CAF4806397.1 unnamed protein product [Rotaria sp. Silwood1]CAF4942820.1 unnamed protein product [Rotaria sp. Silwood1]
MSKDSLPTTKVTINKENHSAAIRKHQYDFIGEIEELEREADKQSVEVELSDYIEFVSQLVDLFKHTVIIPELQSKHNWHDHVGDHLKRNKGITGNSLLDDKIEQIVIEKGLTKEQWKRLLYINFTAGDTLEMIKVSKSHLKKVHDMTTRLLVGEEQTPVLALIHAIEKHMPKSHFTER